MFALDDRKDFGVFDLNRRRKYAVWFAGIDECSVRGLEGDGKLILLVSCMFFVPKGRSSSNSLR